MSISVIIPNYNGEKLIKKNIPHVIEALAGYNTDIELIVIDDASNDNSVSIIQELQSQNSGGKNKKIEFVFLENKKNLGFSPTVNIAAKHAKGEIIIFLNSDVVPEKDFLKPLLVHFKDETVFGVGCMDRSIEGETIVFRGRGIGRWQRGFLIHSRGEVDKKNTLWISGGSCAIRKKLFEKLSGFDELFAPFYWEDIDLSYRAQKSGYKIFFEKESVVVHTHAEGAINKTYTKAVIQKIAYRNQFIFVWKNITDVDLFTSHIKWLPYHVLKALFRFDFSFIFGLLLATFKLPAIIKKRKKQKDLFVLSDKSILQDFS